ncbi:hypothetical protein JOC78_002252 [Bacillus ectoiniformans]|uniref:S-layer homology domain-containing protein n=1 Tax=Bacillus ectoiniformans TaxID=1494429 RepID=UPI0019587F5B|nr:S-layer homology domain-containing protein [Bacillus ectoiniformans]MBM7649299.1 hypothetical protein [Bacillus ectoiniformans]
MSNTNLRKFLATSVTAAVVATAVSPASAAETVTFEDEKDFGSHKENIYKAADRGLIKGNNGVFSPNANITRGQVVKTLARYLVSENGDVDTSDVKAFNDVPSTYADQELYEASLIVKKFGVFEGSNGNLLPNNQITRQAMAKVLVEAFNLDEFEADESQVQDLEKADEWARGYIETLSGLGITVVTEFNPKSNVSRAQYASFLVRTVEGVESVEEEAPEVTEVSALNSKQMVVQFNKNLLAEDADVDNDATDTANYQLGSTEASSAVLSEDKKSVTLTFDGGVEGEDQVLVVNPVATEDKDEEGNYIVTEKFSKVFSFTDTDHPGVISTSYENGKIVLQFSEAIGTAPTVVRVNGTPIAADKVAISSADASKVEIDYTLSAAATADLYVAGAKDTAAAENEMFLFNGTVIAPAADTGKPHVTNVQMTGQNTAKVTLSEAISADTVAAKLQKGAVITDVQLVKDTADTTGKTYTLTADLNGATAGDGIFTGDSTSETFSLLIAADAMTDLAGNKSEEFITSITFVKDTAAPALEKAAVTTGNKQFGFTFDENLTVAGNDANIVVKNAEGVKFNVVDAESDVNSSNAKEYLVDIQTGDVAVAAGTYTVTIPAGFFKDANGNATSAITQTFTVGETSATDTTKPVAAVTNVSGAKNTFEVSFKNGSAGSLEEVTASALNLSNYKVDGKALPAGTEIYFTSAAKNTVRIVLPEGSINIGDQSTGTPALLSVSNVADKAGNTMNAANFTVTVNDNTAATITGKQVIGQDVYVTFSEAVTVPASSTDANDVFDITVNDAEVAAGALSTVAGSNTQVKFTLEAAPAQAPVVEVKESQSLLTDANGVAVK